VQRTSAKSAIHREPPPAIELPDDPVMHAALGPSGRSL